MFSVRSATPLLFPLNGVIVMLSVLSCRLWSVSFSVAFTSIVAVFVVFILHVKLNVYVSVLFSVPM